MLFSGVDFGELMFLVFLVITLGVGAYGFAKNIVEKTTIGLMWASYATLASFFLYQIAIKVEADNRLASNFKLMVERWTDG